MLQTSINKLLLKQQQEGATQLVIPNALIQEYQEYLEEQQCVGLAEIASIYQTEDERLRNKPRRKAVPNPALELDMARYRLKIERKFAESYVNHTFRMPKLEPQPLKFRYSDGVTLVDSETAQIISKRFSTQTPTSQQQQMIAELNNDSNELATANTMKVGMLYSPSSSSMLENVAVGGPNPHHPAASNKKTPVSSQ